MFFGDHPDLFIAPTSHHGKLKPWKPHALDHSSWPPDYAAIYAWRLQQLAILRSDPERLASAKKYYSTRPLEFILHWVDTYDPRRSPTSDKPEHRGPKWMPFVFFTKQAEFITFIHELRNAGENGLCEKARDMGITWEACAYSAWSWLFIKDDAIGWGSRKQELVDKIGDVSSIFEKLRAIIRRLPDVWRPKGLRERDHLTFMKMVNPETGSTITGETGDNIGRGGRTSIYFKDESAHYARADLIEAALGDNTRVQIDISSVNGLGNVFHRKRKAGIDWSPGKVIPPGYVRVFVMDWRDHPEKTQEWYDERKARHEREGLQHIFAQEVDRNYAAAVTNTVIDARWIEAAIDAHTKIPYVREFILKNGIPNVWSAGLDVADGGIDRNALTKRQWIIWRSVEEWGERDTGVTTRRAIASCRTWNEQPLPKGLKLQYDCIGVGSGVKSEFNSLVERKVITPQEIKLVPWNASGFGGHAVLMPFEPLVPDDPDSITNGDMFKNIKAQAWWSLRTRFYKTFKAVTEGIVYPIDDLISLDSIGLGAMLHPLMQELAQVVAIPGASMKTVIDKQPDGEKSPNLADSGVEAYFPMPDDYATVGVGSY